MVPRVDSAGLRVVIVRYDVSISVISYILGNSYYLYKLYAGLDFSIKYKAFLNQAIYSLIIYYIHN